MSYSTDLRITNDDIVLDSLGQPQTVSGAACVSQDLRHMLRERGYLVQLIGERNPNTKANIIKKMELDAEEDRRVMPGSVVVTVGDNGRVSVTGQTVAAVIIDLLFEVAQ
jgi:hypothetical protein